MKQLVLSAPSPTAQLSTEWLVGAAVAVMAVLGPILRIAPSTPTVLLGVLSAIVFAPSIALLAGMITEGRRTFEVVYLSVWYIGPFNGFPLLDFAGVTSSSVDAGFPLVFAVLGLIALAIGLGLRIQETA